MNVYVHRENGMWTAHIRSGSGEPDKVYPLMPDDRDLWVLVAAIQKIYPQSKVFLDEGVPEHQLITKAPNGQAILLPAPPATSSAEAAAASGLSPTVVRQMADDSDRYWKEREVKDAVRTNNKLWLIGIVILLVVGVFWALTLKNCDTVDPSYFACVTWSDCWVTSQINGSYPSSAQVCTYAISGDKEVIETYPDGTSITSKLPR